MKSTDAKSCRSSPHKSARTATSSRSCRRRWKSSRRRRRRSAAPSSITLMALFCLALAWACLGKVDIVASATGKIIPSGRTKVIQPFETGVVRAIHVQDGQRVKAGEIADRARSDHERGGMETFKSDLMAAQLDVARLQAALADGDPLTNFKPPARRAAGAGRRPAQISARPDRGTAGEACGTRPPAGAEGGRARNDRGHGRQTRSIAARHEGALDIRKTLYDHTTGSKANYLEMLQTFVEEQHDLRSAEKHNSDEATAAIAAIDEAAGAGRGGIPARTLRRAGRGRAQGQRAQRRPHQGAAPRRGCSCSRRRSTAPCSN